MADHKMRLKRSASHDLFPQEYLPQAVECPCGYLTPGMPDRAESRMHHGGNWDIVETNNGQILWDPNLGCVRSLQSSNGHQII
jgi:hypothetical protein